MTILYPYMCYKKLCYNRVSISIYKTCPFATLCNNINLIAFSMANYEVLTILGVTELT